MKTPLRDDGRQPDQLRPLTFETGIAGHARGSVLVKMGGTHVLCAASVTDGVPRWMREQAVTGGWITAEYSLLPYATPDRTAREITSGKLSGRTQEIQRLIGRSMRAIMDLDKLGERTIWLDCDVIRADGGTRTAAITGAYVALRLAVRNLLEAGILADNPVAGQLAAISVGLVHQRPLLDLCYTEDLAAAVDMNVVMTAKHEFVELQGTAEDKPFSGVQLEQLLTLARKGIGQLLRAQNQVLKDRQA